MEASRALVGLGLVCSGVPVALANGRPPNVSTITVKRGDPTHIVAGATFGVVVSNDRGVRWRWMCEDAVGYGGMYDPDYAFSATGSLFATTFTGLKIRRDACSFTDAPTGAMFVPTIAQGPTGALYLAAADPADAKIYKSTDDGMTFPTSGIAGQVGDWYSSLEVAPSDPQRVYLSGYRFIPDGGSGTVRVFTLFRSLDGGATWVSLPVTDFVTRQDSTVDIVGISATDPDLVFARVTHEDAIGDAIYRSANGGQSWTRILGKPSTLSFVVRSTGELVAGTADVGSVHSTDNGATWQDLTGAPHIRCLVETEGEVWACAQNFGLDEAGIMKSTDLVTWTKVLRFEEIDAPVDCPAGTAQRDKCDALWCGLCAQLGCDAKRECPNLNGDGPITTPPASKGCCDTGNGGARSSAMLAVVIGLVTWRRRRVTACDRG
jgi:hypothetical protein